MALFAYCRIEYQTVIVEAFSASATLDVQDEDFITGDLGSPTTFRDNGLAITGAQGSTSTNTRVATDTTIDVVSVAGMAVGEHIAIELDTPAAFGTHFWSRINDITSLTITFDDPLPSGVAIGQQVVTNSQLATTTGFSVFEDFKRPKARAVIGNSAHLRTGFILYQNQEFNPTDINLGDLASYLAAGKDPSKYTIATVEGRGYTFTDSDDLFALQDLLSETNSIILTGQESLLSSVTDAINSQAAMDAIVDSRTTPTPTGSGTLQPFVQYDSSLRDGVTFTASGAAVNQTLTFEDSGSTDRFVISSDNNASDARITAEGYRLELNSDSNNGIGIYAQDALGTITIESDCPDTVALMHLQTHGTNGNFSGVHLGSRNPEGLVTEDGGAQYIRSGATTGNLYIKRADGTNTSWRQTVLHDDSTIAGITLDGAATTLTATNGNLVIDSQDGNATYQSTGGNVTVFADGSLTMSADSGTTTLNATGGTFAINAGSNTIDTNCGVFDLDANGAITLSTSAGNVTLEPGSNNNVVLNTTGFIDINAGVSTGKVLDLFTDGIASADSDWYLSNASPEGVITGNGGDVTIVDSGTTSNIYFKKTDASNTGWVEVITEGTRVEYKGYSMAQSGASGDRYFGGFYDAPAADATLTIGGTVTQTLGTANVGYGAHAFAVASGAGGTDLVLTVSGTSIDDSGTRTAADSEIIVADTDAAVTDQYFETTKKWIGQITYTLTGAAGAFTFNYGFAKYEDFGNRDFTIRDFEAVLVANASDSGFDLELLHHQTTGWTYSAAAFVPGTTPLLQMTTDYSTESDLINGQRFAYKRSGLSTAVTGNNGEGIIVRQTTTANNAVLHGDIQIGVNL